MALMNQPIDRAFQRPSQPGNNMSSMASQISSGQDRTQAKTSSQLFDHQVIGETQVAAEISPIVSEEDAHLRICQEMSRSFVDPVSPTQLGQSTEGREIIEYHGGVNPITILGEVLGQRQPKRLVRIILQDSERPPDPSPDVAGLDRVDAEYLYKKGAFTIPPRGCW
jgi:hypothetical protein